MQADLLNTDEVLTRWSGSRNGGGQLTQVKVGKTEWIKLGTPLSNLYKIRYVDLKSVVKIAQ